MESVWSLGSRGESGRRYFLVFVRVTASCAGRNSVKYKNDGDGGRTFDRLTRDRWTFTSCELHPTKLRCRGGGKTTGERGRWMKKSIVTSSTGHLIPYSYAFDRVVRCGRYVGVFTVTKYTRERDRESVLRIRYYVHAKGIKKYAAE